MCCRTHVITPDGYAVMPAQDCDIPLLSYDTALRAITERTGVDALGTEQEAYFVDHFGCKKYKAPGSLISEDNITMFARGDGFEEKGMVKLLQASTIMAKQMVGTCHELAFTAELMIHITSLTKGALAKHRVSQGQLQEWTSNPKLVLAACELYEAPLGGLDWPLYHLIKELSGLLYKGEGKLSLPAVAALAAKGKLNSTMAGDFMAISNFACAARQWESPYLAAEPTDKGRKVKCQLPMHKQAVAHFQATAKLLAGSKSASFVSFASLASEFSYLLGRDNFRPIDWTMTQVLEEDMEANEDEDEEGSQTKKDEDKHLQAALQYLKWNGKNPGLRKALGEECVAIAMLDRYCQRILPVQCPGAADELDNATSMQIEVVPSIDLAILLGY